MKIPSLSKSGLIYKVRHYIPKVLTVVVLSSLMLQGCSLFRKGESSKQTSASKTKYSSVSPQAEAQISTLHARLLSACNIEAQRETNDKGQPTLKIVLSDPGQTAEPNVTGYNSATHDAATCIAHAVKELLPSASVIVCGHTDNVGPYEENKTVSLKRAQAVGNLMIREGLASSQVSMLGLSYDYPIADNHLIEGRAANRRVEIFIEVGE